MPVIPRPRRKVGVKSKIQTSSLASDQHHVSNPEDSFNDDPASVESLFTVAQDRYLARNRCCMPQVDWESLHQNFNQEFKVEREMQELQDRFNLLCHHSMESLLQLHLQDLVEKTTSERIVVHPKFSALAECNHWENVSTSTSSSSNTTAVSSNNEFEDIHVHIVGRDFPQYTKIVSKSMLRQCSRLFDTVIANVEENRGSHPHHDTITYTKATGLRMAKLDVADTSSYYDHISTYSHFSQPVFDRMLSFQKDPSIVSKMMSLQEKYKQVRNRVDNRETLLREIIEAEESRSLSAMDASHEDEVASVTDSLEQALEDDIAALREMHRVSLERETQKLHSKFASRKDCVKKFYDVQEQALLEMHNRSDRTSIRKLQTEATVAAAKVESIFGSSDTLLKLLLLSEDLEIENLQRACTTYLAGSECFQQFMFRPELFSELVADTTVMEILYRLSDRDLSEVLKIASESDYKFFDLIVREKKSREMILSNELKTLSNDVFRQAMRSSGQSNNSSSLFQRLAYYPDIRSRELVRRQEFGEVVLDVETLSRKVSVSEDRLRVEVEAPHRYLTALATKGREAGQYGKWMFEVKIEAADIGGGTIIIGWEVPRKKLQWTPELQKSSINAAAAPNSPRGRMDSVGTLGRDYGAVIPGQTAGADGESFGATWQTDFHFDGNVGVLHSGGVPTASGIPGFREGDVIGCTLDQDGMHPVIRFYLNGVQVIPSIGNRSSTAASAGSSGKRLSMSSLVAPQGITLMNRNYKFYPAVCMYTATRGASNRVRFNFRGDFIYPITLYEPIGADMSDLSHDIEDFNDRGSSSSSLQQHLPTRIED